MSVKYIVRLTQQERQHLEALGSKGKLAVYKVRHAQILLEAALARKKQSGPSRPRRLDAQGEKMLIAVCKSPPPEGRGRWTLRLLGARLVQLEVVDSISPETVRQVLKKTS